MGPCTKGNLLPPREEYGSWGGSKVHIIGQRSLKSVREGLGGQNGEKSFHNPLPNHKKSSLGRLWAPSGPREGPKWT